MGSVDVNKREANGEDSPMFRLSAEGARQFLAQGNALGYERQLPRTLKEFAKTTITQVIREHLRRSDSISLLAPRALPWAGNSRTPSAWLMKELQGLVPNVTLVIFNFVFL
jgi:hypothetical protein